MSPLTFGFAREASPLMEPLVLRVGIATLESQFQGGVPSDLDSLLEIRQPLDGLTCFCGASDFLIYPFAAALGDNNDLRTGRDALDAIKPLHFESDHIASLDCDAIPYPGYRPYTNNDEVHSDPAGQYIFATEEDSEPHAVKSRELHSQLKRCVFGEKLWYVLLHTAPQRVSNDFEFREFVFLFALGKALDRPVSLGVVTAQFCHNLCD